MFVQKKEKADSIPLSQSTKDKEQKQATVTTVQLDGKQTIASENTIKHIKKEKQKSDPGTVELTPEQRMKNNEIWRIIHNYQGPEDGSYDYSLSYEIDATKKVPQEVEDLGRFS